MAKPAKKFEASRAAITLAELKQTPEYAALSERMKVWICTLIETSDFTLATSTAFHCKYPRTYSYSVRNYPVVRAALAKYFGKSLRDLLLDEVDRHLSAAEPGSVAAQRLLAQKERLLLGGKPEVVETADDREESEPAPATPSFPPPTALDPRIPPDALKVWLDKGGAVIGFRDAGGQDVRLSDVSI